jgi:hypothetical protein
MTKKWKFSRACAIACAMSRSPVGTMLRPFSDTIV